MKKITNFKKGSFYDAFFIIGFVFVMGITILIGGKILNEFDNTIAGNSLFNNNSQTIMSEQTSKFTAIWDSVFLFIFVGLFIASIIASLFIDTHPAFFFILIVALTFLVVLTGILANVFESFATNDAVLSTSNQYVFITFVFSHLVELTIGLAMAILFALYAKTRA